MRRRTLAESLAPLRKLLLVLDFRSDSNVPNYLGRAFQRRMLYLVGGLALVVFLMFQARNPDNYWWLFYFDDSRKQEPKIDTRVQKPNEPDEVPGAFVARPPLKRKAVRFDPGTPFHQRVRQDLLEAAKKNDRQRFSLEEREAFAHLIEILDETDQATIRRGPAEQVTYVQLWSQSAEYCGRLVTISGRVRGVQIRNVRPDDYGIDQYYEVWLQHGGGNNNPICICCLELPAGFPVQAKDIDEQVDITGFYYRRWWYKDSADDLRVAPMLLAKTVDWRPAAAEDASGVLPFSLPVLIGMIVAAGAIALLVVLYLFNRAGADQVPDYVRRHMKGAEPGGLDDFGPAPGLNERLEGLRQDGLEQDGLEQADRNGEPPSPGP